MPAKHVVFVGGGTFGDEHYMNLIQSWAAILEREKDSDGKPVATTEVIGFSPGDLMARLLKGGIDVLVFASISKLPLAKTIKAEYKNLRVVVLAGRLPEDEVVLVDKALIRDAVSLKAAILD